MVNIYKEIKNTQSKLIVMKKTLLFSLMLASSTGMHAQDGVARSYFGKKAGVNVSTNKYDPDPNVFDVNSKTGFAGERLLR
jgi:hypothetical protein